MKDIKIFDKRKTISKLRLVALGGPIHLVRLGLIDDDTLTLFDTPLQDYIGGS